MKVTIEIDCTPEETRRFLGLPDLDKAHQATMEAMAARMREAWDGPFAVKGILAADDAAPPVDGTETEQEIGRREGHQLAVRVALGAAGARADLLERAGVEQRVGALADGQAALGVLARDPLGAVFLAQRTLACNFVDFRLPAHARSSASRPVSVALTWRAANRGKVRPL